MTGRARAVAVLCAMALGATASRASESPEVWGEFKVTGAVSDALAFQTSSAARYRAEPWDHYCTHMEVGFDWSVSTRLPLGAYYRHVNTAADGVWNVESRPHADATLTAALGCLGLRDRQRLEWRAPGADASLRYRNKLTVSIQGAPLHGVRPYVAFEPFYDLSKGELSKSRAYAGLGLGLWGPFSADVYYVYEGRKKDGDVVGVGVVGLALKQRF